ncbi:hypothetical protein DSUL_50282 [Desulfovibrionales bacterium]
MPAQTIYGNVIHLNWIGPRLPLIISNLLVDSGYTLSCT